MAVTLTNAQVQLKVLLALDGGMDLSAAVDALNRDYSQNFSQGTGANQANMIWHDQRTQSPSGTESLDLAAGLTSVFGASLTFTRVKALFVKAASGNTNSVQVTRPASNGVPFFMAAGDGVALTPGAWACFVWPDATGIAVTPSTGDLITFTNSAGGTSVTYDIIVIGTV